ncbi:MAG: hypothetical protein WCG08_08290 [Paludibacter sp.]|jgi:hypothetical protein
MLEKLLQYVLPKQREEIKEVETKVRNVLYDKFFNNTQIELYTSLTHYAMLFKKKKASKKESVFWDTLN